MTVIQIKISLYQQRGGKNTFEVMVTLKIQHLYLTRKSAALRVAFSQLLRRAATFGCNGGALRAQYYVFLAEKISVKKNSGSIFFLAVGRQQLAVGTWQLARGRWHVAHCLGAVRKAGIRCTHQLVVGGHCWSGTLKGQRH